MNIKGIIVKIMPNYFLPLYENIEKSPLGYRLAKGTFWSFTGTILSRFLQMLSSIIVARFLGKEGFGELGIIQSTVGMLGVFAGFGLGMTSTKYVAEFRQKNPERAGRIIGVTTLASLIIGGIISFITYLLAPWLAINTLAAPHLAVLLQVSAVMVLLGALNGAQVGTLAGFEAFKITAKVNLWSGISSFPIMIFCVYLWGLIGAVGGLVANSVLTLFLNHIALKTEMKRFRISMNFKNVQREFDMLWSFSLPAFLSGLFVAPVNWACNTMLVNQNNGYSEMGILSAANQWRNVLMFIPMILLQAVLPIMSETHTQNKDKSDFQNILNMVQSIMVVIAFPIATITMFLSDIIIKFYGKGFSDGSPVLIGIISGTLISCIGAATGPAIQAKGKMWLGFAFNLSWGLITLVFVYLTVPLLGAKALAYGYAIAYLILTIWGFIYMSPDLPDGMAKRVFLSLFYAILITIFCNILTPSGRIYMLIPVTILSTFISIVYLSGYKIKNILSNGKLF